MSYIFHAKTAESITETINETDPIYSGSQASNNTSADINNLGNLSGMNTDDQDLNSLAIKSALEDTASVLRSDVINYSAGEGIDISGSTISENEYHVRDLHMEVWFFG